MFEVFEYKDRVPSCYGIDDAPYSQVVNFSKTEKKKQRDYFLHEECKDFVAFFIFHGIQRLKAVFVSRGTSATKTLAACGP